MGGGDTESAAAWHSTEVRRAQREGSQRVGQEKYGGAGDDCGELAWTRQPEARSNVRASSGQATCKLFGALEVFDSAETFLSGFLGFVRAAEIFAFLGDDFVAAASFLN